MPNTHDPAAVVRRLIEEGFSAGRLEVADEVIAADLVEHQDFGPDHAPGAEGVKAVIRSLRRAFPDFRLAIEDVAVAGDTVWTRNVATGTHDGPFMGFAPTGRTMQIDVFDVLRVADGRIVEHWGVPDRLRVLGQIGVLSSPAAAPV
jgi:predicted ester cyclase